MIGQIVTVTVDRPLGSVHPKHADILYSVNYGFVPGLLAPDGEELDAYILGVDVPVRTFAGRVIAVLRRKDDTEDKLVVAPEGIVFTTEEIYDRVFFQERYFQTTVLMGPNAKPRIKGDTL